MDQTSKPLDTNALPWMPLSPGVSVRPLWLSGEERTIQLKVDPGHRIGPHRHTGPVHALTLSGCRRLASGDLAGPGAYVYEPEGNEDHWACEGDAPVIVQITMRGRVEYVGPGGEVTSATDTAGLQQQFLDWCHHQGIAPYAL